MKISRRLHAISWAWSSWSLACRIFSTSCTPHCLREHAGEFLGLLVSTHYAYVIGAVMLISGLLFLANRFVALGLVLLGPVLFNILVFHICMDLKDIGAGLIATLLWFVVFWQHRAAFAGIFAARLEG